MRRSRLLLPEEFTCLRVVEERIRSFMLLAACLVILAGVAKAAPPSEAGAAYTAVMHDHAVVRKLDVCLADIAELTGDDASVLARLAGIALGSVRSERFVTQAEVRSLAKEIVREAEDFVISGAAATRISLALRAPRPEELAEAVKTYLCSVSPWQAGEIEVGSVENLEKADVPDGDVRFRVASKTAPPRFAAMLLPVEVSFDGRWFRTIWLRSSVRVRAQVVRVAGRVPYRGILQVTDLEEAACEIKDPRADYVRTLASAVGMIAKRSLAAGDLLNVSWVESRDLIRNGDTVRLVVQGNGINLSTPARALQRGKLGDFVRVKNLQSSQLVKALVTGPGEVRAVR